MSSLAPPSSTAGVSASLASVKSLTQTGGVSLIEAVGQAIAFQSSTCT